MPFEFQKTAGDFAVEYEDGDASVGLHPTWIITFMGETEWMMPVDGLRTLHSLIGEALAAYDGQGQQAEGDGWIEWTGGDCPVGEDVLVFVRFADGSEPRKPSRAGQWAWGALPVEVYCIVAYRLYKPDVYAEFSDLYGVTE
jgi:hypothetical protein